MQQKNAVILLSVLALMSGCCCYEPPPEFVEAQEVTGYIPEYGSTGAMDIRLTSSQSVENPGKIYLYGKYLLVNEKKRGIHVFDNADPASPVAVGFIQLLGNTDMAIKDGVLYADHMGDVVALTVSDFNAIEEKGRIPVRRWTRGVPAPAGFYFECVDPAKGLVVNWKSAELKNPKCYALP